MELQHQSFQLIFWIDFLWIDWCDILAPWISCPRDSQESSQELQLKSNSSLMLSLLYGPTLTFVHDHWKNHSFDYKQFCQQSDALLFNMLCRFVIAFLPRSKHFLISWLHSLSAVILEPKKIRSVTVSIVSPSICHEVMRPDVLILVF